MNITGAFAAGNFGNAGGMMPNTTGFPVTFNPYNQLQRSVMSADPMSQIGNIAHSLYDPAGNFIPGTDSGELHNTNTIDGGRGSADPSKMNSRHNAAPGTRLDNSNIDRSGIPNYKVPVGIAPGASLSVPGALPPIPENINQSSNLPNALHQMVGNIGNAEKSQFRTENPGSISQLPGSSGFEAVMDVFKKRFA